MSTPTPRTDEQINGKPCTRFCVSAGDSLRDALVQSEFARTLERELAAERQKVRVLHSALQNLVDEQNGAPLERRREEWQEAMDEACAALAATEETK